MTNGGDGATRARKAALAQTDVPSVSLKESLRVARALADELAKQPSTPLQVAAAMGMKPTTGFFRTLTAASLAYGITDAGAWAEKIGLSDLGRRIVSPTSDGDDVAAMRDAVMRPRVTREFLLKYSGSKWPRNEIGQNVLESMGVPAEQTKRALDLIHTDASDLGFITEINGTDFVEVTTASQAARSVPMSTPVSGREPRDPVSDLERVDGQDLAPTPEKPPAIENENRRVFITHGKNERIVEQIKKLLLFGDFEPVISVENPTTAKPVPDKVMDDMRSCSAAIVHVGAETKVLDSEGQEHQMLNLNVLIEIGAAMALYDRRFILLVERGVTLPSNLQGLYEVRYEGSGLDHESTMALLEAFASFKGA
jgi:predicted nucleotide-binding protein